MSQAIALPRSLLAYGLCVVIAVVLGFLLATPTDFMSFFLVTLVLLALASPILLRWHHPILVFTINASIIIPFLPGQPSLWMLIAGLSLGFAVLRRTIQQDINFLHVPKVAYALIVLTLIILVTAKFTGGMGFRAIGSGVYGGKRYYTTLAAIVVYFALVSQPISLNRAGLMVNLFFASGVFAVFSNIAYLLGPSFYFLYAIFPVELAMSQALSDFVLGQNLFSRVTGLSWAGHALFCLILARYGIQGIFDMTNPLKLILRVSAFLGVIALTTLGGFRSYFLIFALVLTGHFYLERIYRTRLFFFLLLAFSLFLVFFALSGSLALRPIVQKLPLSVQRSLSVIPFVEVSHVAKWDAQASTDWRLSMWKLLVPEVPKYLLLGKGYAIDPTEIYLVEESVRRGLAKSYETALVAGDYHNGPLSVIIPFGIFGMVAFLWFCGAGWWVLFKNYKNGDPSLKKINTFFLCYFTARLVFFIAVFGALNSDLIIFTSLVGLSIALNGVDTLKRKHLPPTNHA